MLATFPPTVCTRSTVNNGAGRWGMRSSINEDCGGFAIMENGELRSFTTRGWLSTSADAFETHAKYAVDLELRYVTDFGRDFDRHASHYRTGNIDLIADNISGGSESRSRVRDVEGAGI